MTPVGIVDLGRLVELDQGFVVASQAIERPTETVAIRFIVGIGRHGPLGHLQSTIQVLVLIGPEIAEVVQSRDIVGKLVENLLKELFSSRHVAGEYADVRHRQRASRITRRLSSLL